MSSGAVTFEVLSINLAGVFIPPQAITFDGELVCLNSLFIISCAFIDLL